MKKAKQPSQPSFDLDTVERLQKVFSVCRTLGKEKEALTKVLRRIRELVYFDAATVYVFSPDKEKLHEAAHLGGKVELLSFLSVGAGEGLSGWAAHNRKPVLLTRRSSISSFDPENEYASFMSLPLIAGEKVVGVLNMGAQEERAFTDDDVKLLSLVMEPLALSLERQHYRHELEEAAQRLKEMRRQVQGKYENATLAEAWKEVVPLTAAINNGINNALSVIVGNIQCLLMEKAAATQKSLARLRRIENAAMKISTLNRKVLELHALCEQGSPAARTARKPVTSG